MSYATSNPPAAIGAGPLVGTPQQWVYNSTDVATDVDAVGYFTNGYALGMRLGDLVWVTDTDTGPNTVTLHRVITATPGGAVTISTTGLTIT